MQNKQTPLYGLALTAALAAAAAPSSAQAQGNDHNTSPCGLYLVEGENGLLSRFWITKSCASNQIEGAIERQRGNGREIKEICLWPEDGQDVKTLDCWEPNSLLY